MRFVENILIMNANNVIDIGLLSANTVIWIKIELFINTSGQQNKVMSHFCGATSAHVTETPPTLLGWFGNRKHASVIC